jgi:hypothetical protein
MKNWRRTQKKTLEFIGAEEVGKDKMDGIHPCFVTEVKHKKNLPKWVTGALKQAEGYAQKHKVNRPPLVIIKEKGKHTKHAIAFMWLEDFQDHLGKVEFDGLGIA